MNMMKLYHSIKDGNGPSTAPDAKSAVSPVASFSKASSSDDDDGLVMHNATPQGARLSTKWELHCFLGMDGYYGRFCKNFSSVAAPLTALTSPSMPFIWSSECQQSFENLKGILCCYPVLFAPYFSLPFKLEVDVNVVGAGAVLCSGT